MIRTLIIAAALPIFALNASAAETENKLATCMITNATATQKSGMKQTIILALQENKPAATESLLKFSFEAMSIATAKCGLSFADVQTPAFETAMQAYAEGLGQIVMKDALRMMDIPVD